MDWFRNLCFVAILASPAGLLGQQGTDSDGCSPGAPTEITFASRVGVVAFPHELHTEMGIPCEDCHHETYAERLSMPHPEYFEDFWIRCETCHHTAAQPGCPQKCSACHHGSPTTTADETLSSKVVVHQSCWECHPIGTGGDASRGCDLCHQPVLRGESR